MALTQCKECGKQISKKAASCPNCGAAGKRKTSSFTILVGVIGGLMLFGYVMSQVDPPPAGTSSSSASASSESSGPKVFEMGQGVRVGYTIYQVHDAWYSDQLSDNQYLDEPADAAYVFVDLTVRNDDTKARTIPQLHLVDGNGSEFESKVTTGVDNAIGALDSLNPDVQKRGVVVFDVPPGRDYSLLLDGGYWSSAKALVDLDIRGG